MAEDFIIVDIGNITAATKFGAGRCQIGVISIMDTNENKQQTPLPANVTEPADDSDEIPVILWTYVSPFLFFAGLTGNILSLVVLNRPPIRRSTISLALRLIAFFDCIILVLGLTRHWTKYAFKYDIRNSHSAICKTHMFLVYSALDSSVWNLAALNVGRLIAVIKPLKANLIFTQRRIWLAAFIITGCAMALNSHVFITRGVSHTNGNYTCGYTSEAAEHFWKSYLPYIVLLIYVLGPFVSFSICNTIIIVKVHQEMEGKCKNQTSQQHQDSTMRSLTVMLVAASFTFLLLTTPNVILDFLRTTHADEPTILGLMRFHGQIAIVDVICTLALYINHSLSFYTYLLSGTRFRQEAAVMFCPKLQRRESGWVPSSHSERSTQGNDYTYESRRPSCNVRDNADYQQQRKSEPLILRDGVSTESPGRHCVNNFNGIEGGLLQSPSSDLPIQVKNGRSTSKPDGFRSTLRTAGRSVLIVVEPETGQ